MELAAIQFTKQGILRYPHLKLGVRIRRVIVCVAALVYIFFILAMNGYGDNAMLDKVYKLKCTDENILMEMLKDMVSYTKN
jgi:hypothetical protein